MMLMNYITLFDVIAVTRLEAILKCRFVILIPQAREKNL
jgi:hypothetical protein